jgi:hypothetical protein
LTISAIVGGRTPLFRKRPNMPHCPAISLSFFVH